MKIAIMQPYLFPYLGYFQLIHAVDKFIFYDDVNYIKRGWVNRNQIIVNHQPYLFTVPVVKASQNKLINETRTAIDDKWLDTFFKTLTNNYKRSSYFRETISLVQRVFALIDSSLTIANLAARSVEMIIDYLEMKVIFEVSSEKYSHTRGMGKADRLIKICQLNGADTYINPIGGKTLYTKEYFNQHGIQLFFIENYFPVYPQFAPHFIPAMSIIDVMMHNNKEDIKRMLGQYKLI